MGVGGSGNAIATGGGRIKATALSGAAMQSGGTLDRAAVGTATVSNGDKMRQQDSMEITHEPLRGTAALPVKTSSLKMAVPTGDVSPSLSGAQAGVGYGAAGVTFRTGDLVVA